MLRVGAAAAAFAVGASALEKNDFYAPFSSGSLAPFVASTSEGYAEASVEVKAPADSAGVTAGDVGLVLTKEARRYAVTAPLPEPASFATDEPLVVQYEVATQDGLTCGGAYVKLYDETVDPATVTPNSPYTIMFGPDRCGATDKVHLIIRFKNPVTGDVEEKHLIAPPRTKSDKLSHLYKLELTPDAKYRISIDDKVEKEGSLASDFAPALLPPKEIADPSDSKPADWVDEAQIPDPAATKPEDWDENAPLMIPDDEAVKPEGWLDDEPEQIADPAASKPEDWDDEEDGEWEAPVVPNPKCAEAPGCGEWKRPNKRNPAYKGKWSAPLIANPAYKGVWEPRKIANPAFFEDEHLHRLQGAKIGSIGLEVWTMSGNLYFDNFLVSRNPASASEIAEKTWAPKHAAQEAKAAEEAKEAAQEAAKEAGDSLVDKAAAFGQQALSAAKAAPLQAGALLGGLFLLLAMLLLRGGKAAAPAEAPAAEAAPAAPAAAEPKVNAAGAEESEEEQEPAADKAAKANTGAKRRARKE